MTNRHDHARKLRAAQALADGAKTPGEREAALAAIRRLESARGPDVMVISPAGVDEDALWADAQSEFALGLMTKDALIEALTRHSIWRRAQPLPTVWTCACGTVMPVRQECSNTALHSRIKYQISELFKKGDRVFYNYWAYPVNAPGVVMGAIRPCPENGSYPWAWCRVKFDHLKATRSVPIYSEKGFHLSVEPKTEREAERLRKA